MLVTTTTHFGSVISRYFTKWFVAINYWEIHNLSVGEKKAAVRYENKKKMWLV